MLTSVPSVEIDMKSNPISAEDCLIPIKAVEAITGFKKSWIYESMLAGEFPRAAKCGAATRWSRNEVSQWVKDRLASRALGQPWKR
jgi:predicted DNA-binding transcriptional regulator AlpA